MDQLNVIGIIPARYASSRFPGKPLLDIKGKSMIQRVYEQATRSEGLNRVIVATDDDRIFNAVKDFGGSVIMTGVYHKSGTDRCREVLEKLENEARFDIAVNIQGDEPYIEPAQIDEVIALFQDGDVKIATLVKKIENHDSLFNPNVNKVVFTENKMAIYFSRHPIPFQQNQPREKWIQNMDYFKHIGMYAYRVEVLKEITKLPQSKLEKAESLEQLRWIENGFPIKVGITQYESIAVDTPEDLLKITGRA
ncbi:MAG: 3-deoxy-manno-octulosonate cytidylyltransferase [Bacteroidales bacterium]|nr:3-deoxy-manno-octulosonate cytidylyltransferase [Bacteroidales bacterium]